MYVHIRLGSNPCRLHRISAEFYSSFFPPSQLTSLYAQPKSFSDTEYVHQTGRNTSQKHCVKLQPSEARLMRTKSSWRRRQRWRRCDNMNKWIQQHIFRKIYISWRTSSTSYRGIVCCFSSLYLRNWCNITWGWCRNPQFIASVVKLRKISEPKFTYLHFHEVERKVHTYTQWHDIDVDDCKMNGNYLLSCMLVKMCMLSTFVWTTAESSV